VGLTKTRQSSRKEGLEIPRWEELIMDIIPNTGRSMRQMVRLVGKLDAIQDDPRRFTLFLDNGQEVPCVLVEGDVQDVLKHAGQRVIVGGMGVYELSTRLLRVEAGPPRPAEGETSLWTWVPRPLFYSDLPPEEPSPLPLGLAGFVSHWEDDMTDEEWNEMLEELS
jgi:hypothetical protein